MSIGSGSSGNCYYLGTEKEGFLIDAGVAPRNVSKALKEAGIRIDNNHLLGIVITHDHADHVRSVGSLANMYHLPIYAVEKVIRAMGKSRFIREDLSGLTHKIERLKPFQLGSFTLTPFPIPHDSADNVGYYIEHGDFRFTLATDIGHSNELIESYLRKANHLVIEANYDQEMLLTGSYPDYLKERVASPTGHLSNDEAGRVLARIYHPKMQNIWLCHLSKDNNHPDLCWKSIEQRLFDEGIRVGKDVSLTALKRTSPSPLYHLD